MQMLLVVFLHISVQRVLMEVEFCGVFFFTFLHQQNVAAIAFLVTINECRLAHNFNHLVKSLLQSELKKLAMT